MSAFIMYRSMGGKHDIEAIWPMKDAKDRKLHGPPDEERIKNIFKRFGKPQKIKKDAS